MRVIAIVSIVLCVHCAAQNSVTTKMTDKEADDLVKSIQAANFLATAKSKGNSGVDQDQLSFETDQMKQRKDEIKDEQVEEKYNKPVRMTAAASLEGEVAADARQAVQFLKKQLSTTKDPAKRKAISEAMKAEASKATQASSLQQAQTTATT